MVRESGRRNLEGVAGDRASVPTTGLASRPEGNATGESGQGELRTEDDELDPHTGIPRRWAEFWRATNADLSLGVGFPGPHDSASTSLSDGLHTMPGNVIGPTQDDMEGEDEHADAVAAAPGTEVHTTSSTEVTEGSSARQTDLRSWLK